MSDLSWYQEVILAVAIVNLAVLPYLFLKLCDRSNKQQELIANLLAEIRNKLDGR